MTSLYRYFSGDGVLLYAGISHNPFLREVQHGYGKDMKMVAQISLEWFDCRDAASKAEIIAIKMEKPLWNVAGTKPRKSKKKYKPKSDINYGARFKVALDAFNAMPFCEQLKAAGMTAL